MRRHGSGHFDHLLCRPHTLTTSFVGHILFLAGAATKLAGARKAAKYVELTVTMRFEPLAFETLDSICGDRLSFLHELEGRLMSVTSDHDECAFIHLHPPFRGWKAILCALLPPSSLKGYSEGLIVTYPWALLIAVFFFFLMFLFLLFLWHPLHAAFRLFLSLIIIIVLIVT